jgi:hypothetical protein
MSAVGTIRLLEVGQSVSALPSISDINLFRYCEGINEMLLDPNTMADIRAYIGDKTVTWLSFCTRPL